MSKKPLIIVKCSICNLTQNLQKRSIELNIKNNGKYICFTCKATSKETRKLISEKTKASLKNETIRQKISAASKKNWGTNVFTKEKNLKNAIKSNHNKKKHEKISNTISQKWKAGDYKNKTVNVNKEKITQSLKAYWDNKENRLVASKKAKQAWLHPQKRLNLMNGIIKRDTPEYRKKLSEASKRRWQSQECRNKMAEARANSGDDSVLEKIANLTLKSMGLNPIKIAIDGWTWDILIEKEGQKDVLIDIQGEYFHNLPEHKNRDIIKSKHFTMTYPSKYELHYLEELDFYSIGNLKKRLLSILSIEDLEQINFSFSDLEIKECDKNDGNKFLACYHYLNPSRNGIYHGAFLDGELLAVCVISPVVRKEVATSLNLDHIEVLELSRFCIHPRYQKKNFASWLISRCLKKLKNTKAIVAFSDTTLGHYGTIYKASGFKQLKKSSSTYWYINQTGNYYHKKSVYTQASRNKLTESEYAKKHGLIKIKGNKILKFVKYFKSRNS